MFGSPSNSRKKLFFQRKLLLTMGAQKNIYIESVLTVPQAAIPPLSKHRAGGSCRYLVRVFMADCLGYTSNMKKGQQMFCCSAEMNAYTGS